MKFGDSVKVCLAEWFGPSLIGALVGSGRFRIEGVENYRCLRRSSKPIIYAIWHREIFAGVYAFRRLRPYLVVSEHLDGEIIARISRRFGFRSVRGSTTRGAIRALTELISLLKKGEDVGVTPDGPRGPALKAQPGIIYLAQKTRSPILPLGCMPRDRWILPSWDRFVIPKPRTRVGVVYGEPIFVPDSTEETEFYRLKVEEALNRTMERAEQIACGLGG